MGVGRIYRAHRRCIGLDPLSQITCKDGEHVFDTEIKGRSSMEKSPAIDAQLFRRTLSRFATGVTVITVPHGEHVHGMTANAFMSVSLNPPLVLISVGHNAQMYKLLGPDSLYGVSVL